MLFFLVLMSPAFALGSSYESLVKKMPDTKLKNMGKVVESLEAIEDERLLPLFESMVAGKLYYRKSDRQVIMLGKTTGEGESYIATNTITGASIDALPKKSIKKIRVNNKLRKQLRKAIAKQALFSSDAKRRLAAVDRLTNDLDSQNVALLREVRSEETNRSVAERIDMVLNIALLDSPEQDQRKAAIRALSGELHPVVRNRLEAMLARDEGGEYIEQDTVIRALAESSLNAIDSRLRVYTFIERLFFGLSLGSVLLLAAIGLSITFGVMGVINMAHGELLMLGAYTTYVIQLMMPNHIGMSLFIAIPTAFIFCGLVGIAIERGIIRFLKGRPLETLLATFGLSLVLQQTVRSIFSPLNRQVSTPDWMSGALQINPALALTYNRLYIIIFSLLVFALLLLVMKKTSLGLYVRAVSQNRDMARAVGIRSERVDALTFGLGSGIAGVAGVALSQLTNVGPNLGQSYIIDSFMVVVFGGVGNLWGTLVGAFSLGVVNKFLEPATGAVLAQILVLVFIVLFIQKRPRGLFPQRGRAAD